MNYRNVAVAAASVFGGWLLGVKLTIALGIGVIYVAWHFISKYW